MAKLPSRTELAESPNDADLLHVVDVSDTTDDALGTSKKMTFARIKSYVQAFLSDDTALLTNMAGTGLVTGGVLSINADTTKFDISDGYGYILDHTTDRDNPTYTKVTWTGLTAQVVTNIATQQSTNIAIDVTGAVVQQFASFDENDRRDYIILGGLSHVDNVNVDSVFPITYPAYGLPTTMSDIAKALGFVNLNGNVFSANGANLNMDRTAGKIFSYGANMHTDAEAPHTIASVSAAALSFLPVYQDGSGGTTFGAFTSTIDPDNYDDGDGVLAAVSVNKWTIQRLYMYPNTSLAVVAYGQKEYNSFAEAKSGISEDSVIDLPQVNGDAAFRGWLIVKESETALNSSNTLFITAGKFGDISQSGLTSATTTLQQAYDNSVTPEVITDAVNGALSLQRGSAADTDDVLEIKNGAGTKKAAITGEGSVEGITFGVDSEYDNGNSGATKTIDWGNGAFQKITMTAACTLTFTAPPLKGRYQLKFIQDATGSRVVTHPTILTAAAAGVTLSTGANDVDIVTYYWDGTNYHVVDTLDFS